MKGILLLITVLYWHSVILSQSIFFSRIYEPPETYWSWGRSVIPTDAGYLAISIGAGYDGGSNRNIILCFTDLEGTPYLWNNIGNPNCHYYPSHGSLHHIEGKGYALTATLEIDSLRIGKLILVDYSGDMRWSKTFSDDITGDTTAIILRTSILANNDDFIIVGSLYGPSGNNGNYFIIRADSSGNQKWQNSFGSSANEELRSIAEMPNGDLVFGGYQVEDNLIRDPVVIRTDSNGNIIWQKVFGGVYTDASPKIAIANDSNILIGFAQGYSEPVIGLSYRVLTFMKLDVFGDTIWCKQSGDTLLGNFVAKMIVLDNGNFVAMGTTQIEPNVYSRAFLYKLTDNGDSLWYKRYLYTTQTITNSIQDFELANDNGFILCGGIFTETPAFAEQMWLLKVDSNGCDTCGTGVGIRPWNISEYLSFGIYPNPSSHSMNIRYPLSETRNSIFIYDMFGRLMDEIIIPSGQDENKVDVSRYRDGIYVAVLRNEEKTLGREMFVVKKK
ncbi:MAG: T9SS type A sorting domain-containing protein [Bacteroidota bacterium]